MMKISYSIIFILGLLVNTKHNNIIKGNLNFVDEKKIDRIIGKWDICYMKSGKSGVYFNVCPEINFNEDSTGFINLSSELVYFTWISINDTTINIMRKNANKADSFIESGLYYYNYNDKKGWIEIILKSKSDKTKYYLSK